MTYNGSMSLNIIHLAASTPPNLGGVETHLEQVAKLQKKAGHFVNFFTINRSIQLDKLKVWSEVIRNRDRFLASDIVHVHDVFWWILPLYPLLKLRSIKIVTTFHGWEGRFPVPWQAKFQRSAYNLLSDGTIHIGAWIQEFYGDKPDVVIYGGVDVNHMQPVFNKRKNQVVFYGRLESENSIYKYQQLFRLLKKQGLKDLLWVGDGSARADCQQIAPVTGMVSKDERDKIFSQTTFVCANSYLSMLEAQAAGCIVVALFDHSLKRRYLETYPGYESLITAEDPQYAAQKIVELIADESKQVELQAQSREFADSMDWQNVNEGYEKIYQG